MAGALFHLSLLKITINKIIFLKSNLWVAFFVDNFYKCGKMGIAR